MALTISDIARLAGVSRATVSGVLNNNPTVGEKTKQKVLGVIEKHNYSPNEIARALALKQTGLIGLIVKDISNPLYSQISLGVEDVCSKSGYSLIMGNTHKKYEAEIAYVNILKRRRVDGLIIFPLQKGADLGHIWELKKEKYPYVLLAEVPGIEADLVRSDDEKGAVMAAEHLIGLGRRQIVYVKGPDSALASDRRLRGYQKALMDHNVMPKDELVIRGGWRLEDGYRAGQELCRMFRPLPDGIFCYNDPVAIGLIRALVENGWQIPEDVSVIGFDDVSVSAFTQTALTTVAQPARQIGQTAAELLLDRIAGKDREPRQIYLETRLIVRESCGASERGKVPALNEVTS